MPIGNEARCPACGELIENLEYHADYTEYGVETGNSTLDGEDWDDGDRESNDSEFHDTVYCCPECGDEIGRQCDWPEEEEEGSVPIVPSVPPPQIRDTEIIQTDLIEPRAYRSQKVVMFTCSCGFRRMTDPDERAVICPECGNDVPLDIRNTEVY